MLIIMTVSYTPVLCRIRSGIVLEQVSGSRFVGVALNLAKEKSVCGTPKTRIIDFKPFHLTNVAVMYDAEKIHC